MTKAELVEAMAKDAGLRPCRWDLPAHTVARQEAPRCHIMIRRLQPMTGSPLAIMTSLNRAGELPPPPFARHLRGRSGRPPDLPHQPHQHRADGPQLLLLLGSPWQVHQVEGGAGFAGAGVGDLVVVPLGLPRPTPAFGDVERHRARCTLGLVRHTDVVQAIPRGNRVAETQRLTWTACW